MRQGGHDPRGRLRTLTTDDLRPPGKGRKAFKGFAPKGYRIRVMEPGEAPRLLSIERAATRLLVKAGRTELDTDGPSLERFAGQIIAHDCYVAEEKQTGLAVGYALGCDLGDLYWLADVAVDPAHGRRGIGRALVGSIAARARWAFHRAVGLSTYARVPFNAPFYERQGFVRVSRQDLPQRLEDRLVAETPEGAAVEDRVVMLRWL